MRAQIPTFELTSEAFTQPISEISRTSVGIFAKYFLLHLCADEFALPADPYATFCSCHALENTVNTNACIAVTVSTQ